MKYKRISSNHHELFSDEVIPYFNTKLLFVMFGNFPFTALIPLQLAIMDSKLLSLEQLSLSSEFDSH